MAAVHETVDAVLVQSEGSPEERLYPLVGDQLTIGRGRENDIQLKRDLKVSRYHCKIYRKGTGFALEDMKSSNGSYVNGELAEVTTLTGGEEVVVGDSRFRFRVLPRVPDRKPAKADPRGAAKPEPVAEVRPEPNPRPKQEARVENAKPTKERPDSRAPEQRESAPRGQAVPVRVTPETFRPEVFGRYYFVDKIAMGGMAEIFKAKTFGYGGFENVLAIKRILPHLSDNPQFVKMFMDEAKVTALLNHGNIVRIYDFGKIDRNYFISMECVEGKDVKQVLKKLTERRKTLPREFAVYIAMEAAKGLDFAHKRASNQGSLGIVHRDVSPSNVLISYNGEVKVADFGIVKAANLAEDTDAGVLKGKFEYMSPEQANARELDRRSDIFSLGIILWEMLTGRRLFKTDSETKTLEKIKRGDIDPPFAVNPTVPERLDQIVMRALAIDAMDRYPDARELHGDLLDFLYPAPPDVIQQSLSHFMRELFAEEIAAEQHQMNVGTEAALAIHEGLKTVELEPDSELPIKEPEEPKPKKDGELPPMQNDGNTWLGRLVGRFWKN